MLSNDEVKLQRAEGSQRARQVEVQRFIAESSALNNSDQNRPCSERECVVLRTASCVDTITTTTTTIPGYL